MNNNGGTAFPKPSLILNSGRVEWGTDGMSLLDYFAGAALKGWLASYGSDALHPVQNDTHENIARDSYKMAQAMLKARAELSS